MGKASRIVLVALALVLLLPSALGQDDNAPRTIHAHHYVRVPLDPSATERPILVSWNATAPIDVLVLTSEEAERFANDSDWVVPGDAFLAVRSATQGQSHVTIPPGVAAAIIWDNTANPADGAPGATDVSVEMGAYDVVLPDSSPQGLLRTATFQQEAWALPGLPGMGIAPQAILFLAIAIGCEVVAWREDKRRWIDLGIMVALGALFSAFVSTEGVILPDTRLLTIPAVIVGIYAVRRYRTRAAAVAGVFAACFWGPFLGGDVLSLALHHGTIERLWDTQSTVFVIGGAGWGDALVLVPILGVLSFALRGFGVLGLLERRRKPAPRPVVAGTRNAEGVHIDVRNPTDAPLEGLQVEVFDGDSREKLHGQDVEGAVSPGSAMQIAVPLSAAVAALPALHVVLRSSRGEHALDLRAP